VDDADAAELYRLLEEEIVPAFYDRSGPDQVPHQWVRVVKEAIRTVAPQFSTRRMVKEYVREMYVPAVSEPRKV
jgi:starch phosphorylase